MTTRFSDPTGSSDGLNLEEATGCTVLTVAAGIFGRGRRGRQGGVHRVGYIFARVKSKSRVARPSWEYKFCLWPSEGKGEPENSFVRQKDLHAKFSEEGRRYRR